MIAPIEIDGLPFVLLSELRRLPEYPCVYFVLDSNGTVLYIGQSENPKQRWVNHHKIDKISDNGGEKICWVAVKNKAKLLPLEKRLIEQFRPTLNWKKSETPKITVPLKVLPEDHKTIKTMASKAGMSIQTFIKVLIHVYDKHENKKGKG